jgi:mono/diheme cytochrome c family protein
MAEMHARMMGGGEPGEAPEVRAAAAEAEGCTDVNQEVVDEGQEIFGGTGACFSCHGGDASGTQLGPGLADGDWLNVDGSYGAIAELVRTGVAEPRQYPAPMPPKGGVSLSMEQVCAVAAYVYSLSR